MTSKNHSRSIHQRYESLLSKVTERKSQVQTFIDMLHNQTTWLTSPASTRFHLNCEGGLLQHSVGVAETLLRIKDTLAPDISDETCIIVGLFHDVGKVGMPGKPYYIPEARDGVTTGKYSTNQELVSMGLALRSLYLVSQYMPLSDEEAQAIAYHDGMYVPEGRSVSHREEALLLLLHWADMWTAKVLE
ncbi:MAG: HD domain-containing protein [ANME-2 cluster archaeon]|nr:HD domain-containing protein [ANME-2 cluster archaeon]MDF1558534.1 HD domain-containing protein [ANME-2 cluster archaeon]